MSEENLDEEPLYEELRPWMDEERERYLRLTLRIHGVTRFGPAGLRCADLIFRWVRGFHHFPGRKNPARIDWTQDSVEVQHYGDFSTHDWNGLTRLVFLAHDLAIRAEVRPCNMQLVTVRLHPRARGSNLTEEHPTLEDAAARWRELNPGPRG